MTAEEVPAEQSAESIEEVVANEEDAVVEE